MERQVLIAGKLWPERLTARLNGEIVPVGSVIKNHKGQYGIIDRGPGGEAVVAHPFTKEQVEEIIGEKLPDEATN